jgi:hypothetical protein
VVSPAWRAMPYHYSWSGLSCATMVQMVLACSRFLETLRLWLWVKHHLLGPSSAVLAVDGLNHDKRCCVHGPAEREEASANTFAGYYCSQKEEARSTAVRCRILSRSGDCDETRGCKRLHTKCMLQHRSIVRYEGNRQA